MKKLLFLAVVFFICTSLKADELPYRADYGFGVVVTAATSSAFIDVEGPINDDLVLTGDFSADTNWTKGTDWTIGSGTATFTSTNATTQTLSQVISDVTNTSFYRISYEVSNITSTNTVFVSLGSSVGTVRTSNGRFIEDLFATGNSNLVFTATASDSASFDIDNVKLRKRPGPAYLEILSVENASANDVYMMFNCSGETWSNTVSESRTLLIRPSTTYDFDMEDREYRIKKIWYQAASNTAPLYINGN